MHKIPTSLTTSIQAGLNKLHNKPSTIGSALQVTNNMITGGANMHIPGAWLKEMTQSIASDPIKQGLLNVALDILQSKQSCGPVTHNHNQTECHITLEGAAYGATRMAIGLGEASLNKVGQYASRAINFLAMYAGNQELLSLGGEALSSTSQQTYQQPQQFQQPPGRGHQTYQPQQQFQQPQQQFPPPPGRGHQTYQPQQQQFQQPPGRGPQAYQPPQQQFPPPPTRGPQAYQPPQQQFPPPPTRGPQAYQPPPLPPRPGAGQKPPFSGPGVNSGMSPEEAAYANSPPPSARPSANGFPGPGVNDPIFMDPSQAAHAQQSQSANGFPGPGNDPEFMDPFQAAHADSPRPFATPPRPSGLGTNLQTRLNAQQPSSGSTPPPQSSTPPPQSSTPPPQSSTPPPLPPKEPIGDQSSGATAANGTAKVAQGDTKSAVKGFYQALGLTNPNATDNEIDSAFRIASKPLHPDRNLGNEKQATEAMQRLGMIKEILKNPATRADYNSGRIGEDGKYKNDEVYPDMP